MARIDIDVEDYLDEVDTKYLVQELKKRHDLTKYAVDFKDMYQPEIPKFKGPEQLLNYIKLILGLRIWHDKKRIIKEIEQL
jgi:hypothetical protein